MTQATSEEARTTPTDETSDTPAAEADASAETPADPVEAEPSPETPASETEMPEPEAQAAIAEPEPQTDADTPEGSDPDAEAPDPDQPEAEASDADQNETASDTSTALGHGAAIAAGATTAATALTSEARTPPPSTATPDQPRGSVFPLLLGGVVAGGIGFGAHYLLPQSESGAGDVAPLAADIASLRSEVAALSEGADLGPLADEVASLRAEMAALAGQEPTPAPDLSAIEAELGALRAAIADDDSVDLAPLQAEIAELAAQGDELAALRDALAASTEEIAALRAEMEDLRDLAERRIAAAEAAVDNARARAALDMLRAALTTGEPFAPAIAQLGEAGVNVPEELAGAAQSGIPTLEQLQDRFPDAARAALRDALQGAPADTVSERLGNFLRAQVGARSIAPKEGDDPDAVLSRAGAALDAGDLQAALDEIAALPESAQTALGGWLTGARARIAAGAALPDLNAAITTE